MVCGGCNRPRTSEFGANHEIVVFEPYTVFQTLYRKVCESAMATRPFLRDLKYIFVSFILQLETKGLTAAEIHHKVLEAHRKLFATTYNHLTCLCCLSRNPERGLPCGHTLCEKCIEIFGRKVDHYQNIFLLSACPLCGMDAGGFIANMKPPTAGVRLLSVDGGGIRGVIPLQALSSLERTINRLTGISGPIQEHFDLAIGTSSGIQIQKGLFVCFMADCGKSG
jgi:hypothetical protein